MRKILSLMSVLVLFSIWTFAQQKTVTGKVTDTQGQPIPFATVRIKGAKAAVSADADGNFSIKASPSETLVISGAGVQMKEVPIGNEMQLMIQVSRQSNLDEVVVTALGGRRSRNSLPYAAQQISGDDVNKTITTNVVDNLSGKVSGLEITASNAMGGSTNAILRGFRSLTQSNQALFVVDGVPYDNTITTGGGYDFGSAASDLNPDDIASITVLKGGAASALYGSRGSNGVILVTTKRGSARRGVGVTASFGVSTASPDPSTLPSYQLMYGEGYDDTKNGFQYINVPWSTANPITVVATGDDAATGPLYDKSQVYNWDAFSPTDVNFHKTTPWQPAANHNPTDYFVTPITATENVIVTSGSDQGTFKFAYTRDDEKGYLPNSMIKKNLFDILATYNITRRISVEGALNYVNENATNRYLYQYTATTNPMTDFRQWWPSNVDIKSLKTDYFNSNFSNATWNWIPQPSTYQDNALGNIAPPYYHDNEYWSAYQNYEADSRNRYTGHAKVNVGITDWLVLTGSVSEDNYSQEIEQRANLHSVEPSFYSRQNVNFNENNFNAILNFNKNVGNDFNIKALLGGNVQRDNIGSIFASTNGGLILPGYWSLSNSLKSPTSPTESLNIKEINSLYGGATFSWRDMITLDGTLRRDQSSTLPAAHNVYYYPSVSANWIFSKLIPPSGPISYGKLWANYAQVGGDAPYYSVYNTYTINTPLNGQAIMNGTSSKPNQNLLPEQNKTYEIGLEMNFINNRIGFSADYYHSVQSNEILPISVSTSTGYNTFNVNGGSVQNDGIEATVNVTPVKTRNFTWNMTVNWTKPKNKVLSLFGGQPSYAIAGLQNNIQIVAEVGKPYGVIRGSDFTYLNGQRVIYETGPLTGLYKDSSNALSDIGNIQPSWYGGINNSFTYKNFSLSFLIDVHQGGQVYSLDLDYGSFSGLYPRTGTLNDLGNPLRAPLSQGGGIILKGVTPDGKPNTVRNYEDLTNGFWTFGSGNGNGAEAEQNFVYSATYVKLREVAFTYSIPSKALVGLHSVKGIDLSLSGRNLWIIHKDLPYSDPEQGQAAGNSSIGFQNGAYPSMRTANFIVKVKF